MKFFSKLRQVEHRAPRLRMAPAFEGAGTGRRTRDWSGSVLDINSLMTGSGPALRSRARQAQRNDLWAASGCKSYGANMIGTGIAPQPQHPEPLFRRGMSLAWKYWTDEADADGLTDLYGLQLIAVKNLPTAGEVFARLIRPAASDFTLVPLKVQLIEADHIKLDHNARAGANVIRAGIEVDATRRRVAYHVLPAHPGDTSGLELAADPVPIPAEEMIHVFIVERPGQMRGVPGLAPAIVKMMELHRYDDSTVARMTTAAMHALFVRTTTELNQILPMEGVALTPEQTRNAVEEGLIPLEPGLIQALPPGWDITAPPIPDAGASYNEFMTVQGQEIAAGGFGLSYDQMSGDGRAVNFSSIRAGRNEAWRRAEADQHAFIVFQFCRRLWKPFLEAALMAGAFDRLGIEGLSNSAMLSAYNKEPLPFLDVTWHAQGQPSVNPLQDAQAAALRIKTGISSRSQEVRALSGLDPEEVDRQNAADQQREKELGLRYGDAAEAAPEADEQADETADAPPPPKKAGAFAGREAGMVQ